MKLQLKAFSILLAVLLGAGISGLAQAEDRLARIFQDNMVLQREMPVPIWGWANPGTQVEVSFGGQKKEAKADEHGYWKAILDPMVANRAGQVLTAQIGTTTVNCKDVLVGEVWMSIGHSNTGSPGPNVDTGIYPRYISTGTKGGKPEIRFFSVGNGASLEPYDDLDPLIQGNSHWSVMKEDPAPDNDNVTRSDTEYFARILRDKLDVPVGILFLGCVGVGQQTWMSRETLEGLPADNGAGNCYQEKLASAEARYAKECPLLKSFAGFAKAESEWRVTKKGAWPPGGDVVGLYNYPTAGYNTRIHPLAPYALRGVRLFAGPNIDTGGAAGIVAMVKQWRELYGQDFYFINCPSVRYATSQPPLTPIDQFDQHNYAIYEALKQFGGDKREDVPEFKDLGDWLSHYLQKAEAGRRLGLCALNLAYGQKNIFSGPRMAETKIEGSKATVRFDLVGEGISYQPSIDGISGVYLRGESGKTAWAEVNVTGKDTIECSSPDIPDLETVAYGANTNAHETLFNSAGLPASPFLVNPPPVGKTDPQPPFQIVTMQGEDPKFHVLTNAVVKNAKVDLAHLRRSGYVFQIVGDEMVNFALQQITGKDNNDQMEKSSATIPMIAYIPKEWNGYEVMIGDTYYIRFVNGSPLSKGLIKTGGKLVNATETTTNGNRFVTFDAPIDRTWIIVAEAGKAKDFLKINRY